DREREIRASAKIRATEIRGLGPGCSFETHVPGELDPGKVDYVGEVTVREVHRELHHHLVALGGDNRAEEVDHPLIDEATAEIERRFGSNTCFDDLALLTVTAVREAIVFLQGPAVAPLVLAGEVRELGGKRLDVRHKCRGSVLPLPV